LSQSHDYSSKEAQDVFEKHKQWLKLVAPFYNKEYHLSLAECYLSDERFSDYYNNRAGKDAARTLTAIIQHYA
ncbi:MAG: TipAS antibiotic-recognition domain-containing protein, partial [Enterococcus aquimarinus]